MKIKIGNDVYDSDNEMVMVIMSDEDKANISNMSKTATKYAVFPDDSTMSTEQMYEWMNDISPKNLDKIDKVILEEAVKHLTKQFDEFIGNCSINGKPKEPTRGDVALARGCLPSWCKHSHKKVKK